MPYVLYVQNPPATFPTPVASQDVYANPGKILTALGSGGGGGGVPANVPGPTPGAVTSSTIEITFDVSKVTGTEPITYDAGYSPTSGGPYQIITLQAPVGTVYTGTANGLDPNTTYYFVVKALNAAGQTTSTEVPVTTSAGGVAPSGPPGLVSTLSNPSVNTIDVTWSTLNVTGTPTPSQYFQYATAEAGPYSIVQPLSLVAGYNRGSVSSLTSATPYYFQSAASNASGQVSSAVTVISTAVAGPVAPTAPTAPQPSLANNGGLISTLYFDVAGVTGTPPITYDMFWTDTNSLGAVSTVATLSSGTIYTAVVNSLATSNALFQVYSRASNAVGVVNSDNTAIFGSTLAGPVTAIPSSIGLGLGLASETAITLSTSVIRSGNPEPEIVAKFGVISSSLISTTDNFDLVSNSPVAISTLQGLASSTTFYFNSLAYNIYGSTVNTTITALSTLGPAPPPPGPTPPSVPPALSLVTAGISTISVSLDATNVTGTQPITYSGLYGITSPPTSSITLSQSGTTSTFVGNISSLTSSTNYYLQSLATNSVSTVSSVVSVLSTITPAPGPPSGPPTVPIILGGSQGSTIVGFDVSGITGTLPFTYSMLYGTDNATYPSSLAVTLSTGNVYQAIFTESLVPLATSFFCKSQVSNSVGTVSSVATSAFELYQLGVPVFITGAAAQATSFSFTGFTPAVGTGGYPNATLYVTCGLTSTTTTTLSSIWQQPGGAFVFAEISSLSEGTVYYVNSVASNAAGIVPYIKPGDNPFARSTLGAPPPPPPSTINYVSTILGVGFLTFGTGGFSSIILDTSQNVSVGNWQADGVITYSSTPPGGISGPQYLSTLQGAGNKIVLSLGGASDSPPVLSTMFGLQSGGNFDTGAANLAESLAYAYFGGSGANPLGFAKTDFDGFAFDGLDLDIEAVTPSTTTLLVFASTLKGNPAFANKIITAAPQTPYLTQATTSGLNANNTFQSFSEMNPGSVLNAVYTGNAGNQASLFSPTSGNLIDIHFIQAYNNASYSYPTGANSGNWNNVVAAWGIQSLQSGYPGKHPKNVYAFATTDGTPLFDPVADAAAFNISLSTANSTIRAFSTTTGVLPYSSVTVADWCAGIGFWAANTVPNTGGSSPPVLSTLYGQPSTLNNMPTNVCMTYGGVFNSVSWGLTAGVNVPVPNARGY